MNGLTNKQSHLISAVWFSLAGLLSVVFTTLQIEKAAALDVGVSGGAAGLGAGLDAGIGSEGISAGAGASSRGNGASVSGSVGSNGIGGGLGANAGGAAASASGSIGSNGRSAGAGLSSEGSGGGQGLNGGVGASLGGNGAPASGSTSSPNSSVSGSRPSGGDSIGAGASAPASGGNPDPGTRGEANASGVAVGSTTTVLATSSVANISFPEQLWPSENEAGNDGWFRSIYLLNPLRPKPGTPLSVVQSCRNALVPGASRYGATQVDVASAGRITRLKDGSLSAPVEARVVFRRGDRVQVRQARVTCRLDAKSRMVTIF